MNPKKVSKVMILSLNIWEDIPIKLPLAILELKR